MIEFRWLRVTSGMEACFKVTGWVGREGSDIVCLQYRTGKESKIPGEGPRWTDWQDIAFVEDP